ncbi:MAG: nucleotidyltransferase domain-containing protein [Thermodesulfobacteriota bacterium]|nr:nucleotidyltransferase domain-containing protein [Thermodesulfobacteriota bacterium]
MLEQSVLKSVRDYQIAVNKAGISVEFIVVFGSQVKGGGHEWSDIDLLVVSPQFDDIKTRKKLNLLWHIAASVDIRIEPIPCGLVQWDNDDMSAIIEIARREGEILRAA